MQGGFSHWRSGLKLSVDGQLACGTLRCRTAAPLALPRRIDFVFTAETTETAGCDPHGAARVVHTVIHAGDALYLRGEKHLYCISK